MNLKKVAFGLSLLLITLTANQITHAQLRYKKEFVIPDNYYVARRCKEPFKESVKWVRRNKKLLSMVNIEEAERVADEMSILCKRKIKEEISGDMWLEKFEEYSRMLYILTTRCGRTVMCESHFLIPSKPIPNNLNAYSMFLFSSME